MIKAGLPLRESITSIQEQSKNKFFKNVLENIIKSIDNGQSLAVSLSRYPKIFDHLFVNMIKIGEEAGTLEENLGYLALQMEKSNSLKKKTIAAMIYPAIVLAATFILGGVLSIFILPKLIPLFKSLNVALPLSTKILLYLAELIQNYWLYIFLSFCFLILFIVIIYRFRAVKLASHRILLALPLAGKISQNINLSLFSRNLGDSD